MEYFVKIEQPAVDLAWNIPELKQGILNVVGGNGQSFKTTVKVSEFLASHFPIETLNTVLPDTLKPTLPPFPNFLFLPATESGSFASADSLSQTFNSADFNFLIGDLSKNSITRQAVSVALQATIKPVLVTRDAVDLLSNPQSDQLLANPQIMFLASMPQLQALLRSVYYPKILLLSQSLLQVVEVLHKFTLSYPAKIITLHTEQILIAENGLVRSIPLNKTPYAPFTFWSGELAAKISAYNLFNPHNFLEASISAILS